MTDQPPNGGLGISGARRLERIELTVERTNDKMDARGTEVHAALRQLAQLREDALSLDKRVRSLELRFYGILAGLVTAIGVIVWQQGGAL